MLSGGNQQKVSVAKWLAAGVEVLIVDEPTVGIDISTKAYLHELLRELARRRHRDPADLAATCRRWWRSRDRILVMSGFRIKGEVANDDGDYARASEAIMAAIHRPAAA